LTKNISGIEAAVIRSRSNTGRALMKIQGKLPEGYVVLCNKRHEEHCFLVKNLSVSVECPRCGWTALSGDLLAEYTLPKTPDDPDTRSKAEI
jgi:hypothetical protein